MKQWFIGVVVVAVLLAASAGVGFWKFVGTDAELTETRVELTEVRSNYDDLEGKHKGLQSDYEALQSDYEALQSDYEALLAEHQSLQSDYEKLNVDYEATNKQLGDIKRVYPPTYFANYGELTDWVDRHTPIRYTQYNIFEKHLELQQEALADGYIWSVHTEPEGKSVISTVVAGDSVYYVWLEGYMEWAYWR